MTLAIAGGAIAALSLCGCVAGVVIIGVALRDVWRLW